MDTPTYEAIVRAPLPADWREMFALSMSQPPRSRFTCAPRRTYGGSGAPVIQTVGSIIEDAIEHHWKVLRDQLIRAIEDRIAAEWPDTGNHIIRDDTDPRVDTTSTLVVIFEDRNTALMFKLSL